MSYLDHWKLKAEPFDSAPDARFFFESDGHREAVTRLLYAMRGRKLIALLTGDYGVGKTTVCETALAKLPANEFKTAFIRNPRMDALDLTRELIRQLGEAPPARSQYDALLALNTLLDRHAQTGRHCVAVVDEAQTALDASVFEDLRLLLNREFKGKPVLTLVFSGQTELGDMLKATPQMMQRIALKFHIPNLTDGEVRAYVAHRLRMAGGAPEIFADDALRRIAALSKGNAREVNTLCDLCLLIGHIGKADRITEPTVEEAWKERE